MKTKMNPNSLPNLGGLRNIHIARMLQLLPYGQWTYADGTEILFNRYYQPIFKRNSAGVVSKCDPDCWIDYDEEAWFFTDPNSPWFNKETFKKCVAFLTEWGVPVLYSKWPNLEISPNDSGKRQMRGGLKNP
jgi:hypothetical protein